MRPLTLSLSRAGHRTVRGWIVFWADGQRVDSRDFFSRAAASVFFSELSRKHPGTVRVVEGRIQ